MRTAKAPHVYIETMLSANAISTTDFQRPKYVGHRCTVKIHSRSPPPQNDTATVTIIVLNVNDWDPRFRHPNFDFAASPSARPGDVVGRLGVYDGDRGDRVSLGLMGQDAR